MKLHLGNQTQLTILFVLCVTGANAQKPHPVQPVAPTKNVVDNYFGTTVTDPYRNLENFKDPGVAEWLKGQDSYARNVLSEIPGYQDIHKQLLDIESDSQLGQVDYVDRFQGDLFVFRKRLASESVAKLYVRNGLAGQDRLLVDPELVKLAADVQGKGKNTIGQYSLSQDGKYLSVAIVPGGSEIATEIHVFDVASGRETGDVMRRAMRAPSWLPDNHSFVYSRLRQLPPGSPQPEVYRKIRSYLHVLGNDPAKDVPIFGDGVASSIPVDPDDMAFVGITPGSQYAIGVLETGVTPAKQFYLAPVNAIGSSNVAWRKVAALSDSVSKIAIHGNDLYVLTFKDAPRYKIICTDAQTPDLRSAKLVVPPSEAVIGSMSAAHDALYAAVLNGGISQVLRVPFEANVKAEPIIPPEGGLFLADVDPNLDGALLAPTSWTKSPTYVTYDPKTGRLTDTRFRQLGRYDAPQDIEAEEVKVASHDGTLVPLSIIHRKGMKLDGSNPTVLTGYGSYGYAIPPFFDKSMLAWHERGGIYAVCHVRGGGEYGEQWHLAGKESTKPNTWLDFIACGEYLIGKQYTSAEHLGGMGESAGGIMIGRAITERPDLFGAAVIGVGILDTVRFETTANGAGNVAEFGSVKTKAGFDALYEMSSYHHVRNKVSYPAVLLTTGINDAVVDPWQTAKMTAKLQGSSTSGKPILMCVNGASDHWGGTAEETKQEQAGIFSFLLWQLTGAKAQASK